MTGIEARFAKADAYLGGAVEMIHGSGGRATAELVRNLFHRHLGNAYLAQGNDQAAFDVRAGRLVMTTDAHVIAPLFFPGGDIGSLAVHGTINDVAMAGARPLYLSAAFVLEEGFPLGDLDRIVASMARASREAGAPVITGDTKVVEKGKGDGVFITTTGIGIVPEGVHISGDRARPGDAILVSGTLGDHGIAVLSKRENLEFETEILSDSAALHGLVADMVAAVPCNSLPARSDARRARLDAQRNRAAIARGHASCRERDPVQGRMCSRPANFSASIRSTSPTKASSSRSAKRAMPRAFSPRCAPTRSAGTPRSSERSSPTPTLSSRCRPGSAETAWWTGCSETPCHGSVEARQIGRGPGFS